jgi:2-oxoglutarate dehydrogenase complex dehydrogenase (E1) component-like enzyme
MTQVLACTGAAGNRATLEEMLPIVTYAARAKWGNIGFQGRPTVKSLEVLQIADAFFKGKYMDLP